MDNDRLALSRAAAFWRVRYAPSFAGLQQLRSIVSKQSASKSALLDSVRRKAESMPLASRQYPMFKEYAPRGKHVYRECVALSPWSALVEASVMSELSSRLPALPECVYSYKLETPGSSFVFGYFVSAFERRVRDIGAALRATSNAVAVVADIKNFYPSIPKSFVRESVSVIASGCPHYVRQFLQSIGDICDVGLPVGPAASHVLANQILASVDFKMSKMHPGRYFRYVDDLVVVCGANEASTVVEHIKQSLQEISLTLNEDKTAVLSAEQWFSAEPSLRDSVPWRGTEVDFSRLLELARSFWMEGGRPQHLLGALVARGIPVFKLLARHQLRQEKDNRIRARIVRFLSRFKSSPNAEVVAEVALTLRDGYKRRIRDLFAASDEHPLIARWRTQRALRLVGRLAFLTPTEELSALLGEVPERGPTWPIRAVLMALIERRPGLVLPFAGGAVRQLCFLWNAHELGTLSTNFSIRTKEYLESALELVTHGVVTPESVLLDSELADGRLAQAMLHASPRRTKPDFSFEDELEALYILVPVQRRFRSAPFRNEEDELADEPLS